MKGDARTQEEVLTALEESAVVVQRLQQDSVANQLVEVSQVITRCLKAGHKVLLLGNGGSASQAQHIAGELVGRFLIDRPPLNAVALTTDGTILTCISNDYSFHDVFARQVRAVGVAGDVVCGLSTSGRSRNVIQALEAGRDLGLVTVGLTGDDAGDLAPVCDYLLRVPATSTARIQEGHAVMGHVLCEVVERALFG